jgi:23S rRNA pseudouridine1911/1915/1917 synthase
VPEQFTSEVSDRADKAIAHHFPGAGRKQIATLFDDGGVKVNGKRVKKGDRVAAGDAIELARTPAQEDAPPLPNAEAGAALVVLLEHADFVAIAKPAGMPSQPLRADETGTAANAIVARWPECASAVPDDGDPRDGGLVHRLDIGTSGVLVAARNPDAYKELRAAFGAGVVAKHYLALVENRPVSRECDLPLVQRGKKVAADMTDGLAAHTAFEVLAATENHALVRCLASTGRMHQVRAHLSLVGAPIVGDVLYGAATRPDGRFFLHAADLALTFRGAAIALDAPVPPEFAAARTALGL